MVKSVNVCAKTAITASFQIKKSSIGTVKVKVKILYECIIAFRILS